MDLHRGRREPDGHVDSQSRRRRNLPSAHGAREGEAGYPLAGVAVPVEGATRAPFIDFLGSSKYTLRNGEMTELAEGARLLSECTGLNSYRGFKSLSLRHSLSNNNSKLGVSDPPVFLSPDRHQIGKIILADQLLFGRFSPRNICQPFFYSSL